MLQIFAVTGTFHGSIIWCKNEGEARKIFQEIWNGKSILIVKNITKNNINNL